MSVALATEQAVLPTQMLLIQILHMIRQCRQTDCEDTLEQLEQLVARSIEHNTPRHQKTELQSR